MERPFRIFKPSCGSVKSWLPQIFTFVFGSTYGAVIASKKLQKWVAVQFDSPGISRLGKDFSHPLEMTD
jgi:hypothetical protein